MVSALFMKDYAPSGSVHACDELVAAFAYLCRRGARKFLRAGLERSDLEQVAAVGLVKAARRYDASLQTPFEAYAWLIVVGELMHYVRDHERAIRVPRRLRELERRYVRAHEVMLTRLGREPKHAEIAEELGILLPTIVELRQSRASASLARIDQSHADELPEPSILELDERIVFDDALAALSLTERRVIAGIYVLGLTRLEISRRLGVSAKRVSRLHHAALGRMARTLGS